MIPQLQVTYGRGSNGDCYRAAIASLCGVPSADLPHVFHDDPGYPTGFERMREHLATVGLRLFQCWIKCSTIESMLSYMQHWNPGEEYVLIGTSNNGTGHAVVCCGGAIIHDPNPLQSGIAGPFFYKPKSFIVQTVTPAPAGDGAKALPISATLDAFRRKPEAVDE